MSRLVALLALRVFVGNRARELLAELMGNGEDAVGSVIYWAVAGVYLVLMLPAIFVAGLLEAGLAEFVDAELARDVAGLVLAVCGTGAIWFGVRGTVSWARHDSAVISIGWIDDVVVIGGAIAWQVAIALH